MVFRAILSRKPTRIMKSICFWIAIQDMGFEDFKAQAMYSAIYLLWLIKQILQYEEIELQVKLKAGNLKTRLHKTCPERSFLWVFRVPGASNEHVKRNQFIFVSTSRGALFPALWRLGYSEDKASYHRFEKWPTVPMFPWSLKELIFPGFEDKY